MNIYDIVTCTVISTFVGIVGYYLGRIWSYKHSLEPMIQQSHYWKFRYYQTLEDLQDLEEETTWLADWCPDKDKE